MNAKKNPKKQIEKFSTLFMQLGLVLVLLVVYMLLESRTEEKILTPPKKEPVVSVSLITDYQVYQKEVKKVKKAVKKKPVKLILDEIEKKKEEVQEAEIIDEVIEPVVDDHFNINTVETEEEPVELAADSHIYDARIYTPIFKGCEGLKGEKNRKCFEKKMKAFVLKKFPIDLAINLGLNEGKYKIYSQFVIDKKGNVVDIQIKAPHKRLEKEMRRILEKLPQFIPGLKRGEPINVSYILPLTFEVD